MRILTNALNYMVTLDDELIAESKTKTQRNEFKELDKVTKIMFGCAVTLLGAIILINI